MGGQLIKPWNRTRICFLCVSRSESCWAGSPSCRRRSPGGRTTSLSWTTRSTHSTKISALWLKSWSSRARRCSRSVAKPISRSGMTQHWDTTQCCNESLQLRGKEDILMTRPNCNMLLLFSMYVHLKSLQLEIQIGVNNAMVRLCEIIYFRKVTCCVTSLHILSKTSTNRHILLIHVWYTRHLQP